MDGKHILLGISGSIASYKAAILVRLFKKAGAEVRVIMTRDAENFITPLTLSTLSKNEVYTEFEKTEGGLWNNHVELGNWADVFLIAPATANTLSKMAHGQADNLLLATYLSAKCPVFFAPAMDLDMWIHPSTQKNIETLVSFGNHLIEPGTGELASGLSGDGRLSEPENILKEIEAFFKDAGTFNGKKVLITAGPTQESLDPVRYLSNHSSGKMGYSLAQAFAEAGAEVFLVSGPTSLKINHPKIQVIPVRTAEEMFKASGQIFPEVQIAILTAAVADYRPADEKPEKIKSNSDFLILDLIRNPDIAKNLGSMKQLGQLLIGFALETENEIEHAQKKIISKNLDFIVLNSMKDDGATFGHDTNKVTIIDRRGLITEFSLKSKREVARDILQYTKNLS